MGRWVRKGQMLRTNLHYHPNGTPQVDRTRVGLYFGKGDMKKEVAAALAGNITFSIPPGAAHFEMRSVYMVDQDINVVSFFPHMHLRGTDMKMTATFPDGRQETLLNVPEYDFNWQLFYYPKETVALPKGTRVDLVAHYDNSSANKHNPDPTKAVTFGEASTNEMMFGLFEFTAVAGVSPKPSTERERMESLVASLPADSSFLIDLPFGRGADAGRAARARAPETARSIRRRWGCSCRSRSRNWSGKATALRSTRCCARSVRGGFYTVTGTIGDDGTSAASCSVSAAERRRGRCRRWTTPGARKR